MLLFSSKLISRPELIRNDEEVNICILYSEKKKPVQYIHAAAFFKTRQYNTYDFFQCIYRKDCLTSCSEFPC